MPPTTHLYNSPPPPKETLSHNVPSSSITPPHSSSSSSWIRLFDSSGKKILGYVPTHYEDSFSLETFEDSIKAHQAQEWVSRGVHASSSSSSQSKCFILARVQTCDPKQPTKEYYSYYNAYYLNKILFNTQVYLGKKLIHRMHVLNPLTNSDILGHVLYFLVQPIPTQLSLPHDPSSSGFPTTTTFTSTTTTTPTTSTPPPPLPPPSRRMKKPSLPRLRLTTTHTLLTTTPTPTQTPRSLTNLPPFPAPSPTLLKAETDVGLWTLASPSVSVVSDVEYPSLIASSSAASSPPLLTPTPSSSSSSSSFSNQVRRVSSTTKHVVQRFAGYPPSPWPTSSQPPSSTLVSRRCSVLRPMPMPTSISSTTRPTAAPPGFITIDLQWPSSPLYLNAHHRQPVPPGQVTQFAVPMIATSSPLSTKIKEEEGREKRETDQGGGGERSKRGGAMQQGLLSPTPPTLTTTTTTTTTMMEVYDAQVFATDTDFLERSGIRQVFREHAVHDDLITLFELPAYTGPKEDPEGEGEGEGQELVWESPRIVFVEEAHVCDLCCPPPPPLSPMGDLQGRSWKHRMHVFKCGVLIIGILSGLVVLVVAALRYQRG
ncbi:hypothetical protein HMI55_001857 [Coelomomyces lativittatus]|nr:hypothetical protein HMI56_006891 [Coelomomyces lativittatus]KAJ1516607.1 hypothetical protein HMI55_001857 [Coelomomyces lativittatus]